MKRREFLTTAATVSLATAATAGTVQAQTRRRRTTPQPRRQRQYIELRTYRFADANRKAILIESIDKALIPALNRQGIATVGAFTVFEGEKKSTPGYDDAVFVVIPYNSAATFTDLNARLLADKKFVDAAAAVLKAPLAETVYQTAESTLMYGFPQCPRVEVPTKAADRIAQLRYYKSHNIDRNALKIRMFDVDGELRLFRESGMNPIFFGETLFGQMMPNLTYMLGFESVEALDKGWAAFVARPEWKKLSQDPLYHETATKIDNVFLKPTVGSQI